MTKKKQEDFRLPDLNLDDLDLPNLETMEKDLNSNDVSFNKIESELDSIKVTALSDDLDLDEFSVGSFDDSSNSKMDSKTSSNTKKHISSPDSVVEGIDVGNKCAEDDPGTVDYDSLILSLKSSAELVDSNTSALNHMKKNNKELESLISNYKSKSEYDSLSKENLLLKKKLLDNSNLKLNSTEEINSNLEKIYEKDSEVYSDMADLEFKKLILDSKERILSQGIVDERNPQVISVLKLIDSKLNQLFQEESVLKSKNLMLEENKKNLELKEKQILMFEKSSFVRKQNLEQDILNLNSIIEDKKMEINSLDSKRSNIETLIKERKQLVQDLDKQFYSKKEDLENLKQSALSEKRYLERLKNDLNLQKDEFSAEKNAFNEQKQVYKNKLNQMVEKTKNDLIEYKKNFMDSLNKEKESFKSFEEDLKLKESMIEKLQSELKKRELKLSEDLDYLSKESYKLRSKSEDLDKRESLLIDNENELKSYESEVNKLENTIFDLKSVLESKENDFKAKEDRLQKYAEALKKAKYFLALEQDFIPLVNDLHDAIDSKNASRARDLYGKLNNLFKLSGSEFQRNNLVTMKNLHLKVSKLLKKSLATRK